jgi:rubredoxin
MSKKDKVRANCPRCRHRQLFIRATVNHPLHLVLSICTAGLWLVSWLAVCIGSMLRPWRCEHCGWHKPEFGPALGGEPSSTKRSRWKPSRRHRHTPAPLIAAETSRLTP